jgi:hypothetical protein
MFSKNFALGKEEYSYSNNNRDDDNANNASSHFDDRRI